MWEGVGEWREGGGGTKARIGSMSSERVLFYLFGKEAEGG